MSEQQYAVVIKSHHSEDVDGVIGPLSREAADDVFDATSRTAEIVPFYSSLTEFEADMEKDENKEDDDE